MSVSLYEVISSAGYDLTTPEGANWLLAQRNQFESLVESAESVIEAEEEARYAEDSDES